MFISERYNDDNKSRPSTPKEDDCCGQGCNPCIFDVHRKMVEDWEKRKSSNQNASTLNVNYLSPLQYKKFILKTRSQASEDCIFIELESEGKQNFIFYPSQHVIFRMPLKSKAYTPISWTSNSMKFVIKLYKDRESSNHINQLKQDDAVFVRGPYGDFQYFTNRFKYIVMLGIGSGIAPLYPIAVSIISNEKDETKVKMMLGFHSLSHVPLLKELRQLSDYWNFECCLCLSEKISNSASSSNPTGIDVLNNRMDKSIINLILSPYSSEETFILFCGTPTFNEFVESLLKELKFQNYYKFE